MEEFQWLTNRLIAAETQLIKAKDNTIKRVIMDTFHIYKILQQENLFLDNRDMRFEPSVLKAYAAAVAAHMCPLCKIISHSVTSKFIDNIARTYSVPWPPQSRVVQTQLVERTKTKWKTEKSADFLLRTLLAGFQFLEMQPDPRRVNFPTNLRGIQNSFERLLIEHSVTPPAPPAFLSDCNGLESGIPVQDVPSNPIEAEMSPIQEPTQELAFGELPTQEPQNTSETVDAIESQDLLDVIVDGKPMEEIEDNSLGDPEINCDSTMAEPPDSFVLPKASEDAALRDDIGEPEREGEEEEQQTTAEEEEQEPTPRKKRKRRTQRSPSSQIVPLRRSTRNVPSRSVLFPIASQTSQEREEQQNMQEQTVEFLRALLREFTGEREQPDLRLNAENFNVSNYLDAIGESSRYQIDQYWNCRCSLSREMRDSSCGVVYTVFGQSLHVDDQGKLHCRRRCPKCSKFLFQLGAMDVTVQRAQDFYLIIEEFEEVFSLNEEVMHNLRHNFSLFGCHYNGQGRNRRTIWSLNPEVSEYRSLVLKVTPRSSNCVTVFENVRLRFN